MNNTIAKKPAQRAYMAFRTLDKKQPDDRQWCLVKSDRNESGYAIAQYYEEDQQFIDELGRNVCRIPADEIEWAVLPEN